MATVSKSMATKLRSVDDQKSGVDIQTKGYTLTPPSGQNGSEDTEAFGSTPSCSPSQSLVRKSTPDHPKTQSCLEIHVVSTEDGGMHHHSHTPVRCQLWKTWSKIANLA